MTPFDPEPDPTAKALFGTACTRPWLIAAFAEAQEMVSWSLNRPGFVRSQSVAWLEVHNDELRGVDDAEGWFRQRLAARGLAEAVGMMTARDVSRHERVACDVEGVRAECLITLGLNNGEHVGRRVGAHLHPLNAGTINLLCAVSMPLSQAGLLEAASLAAQARTVALVEAGYRRPGRGEIVTGTGTDCIVVSAPAREPRQGYAGMHTAIGEAVGACVLDATRRAVRGWREDGRQT